MAQTFTHLLTQVIFSAKRRRALLKVEIKPCLFSYAPAGLVRFWDFVPRGSLRSTLGYNPAAASRLPSPGTPSGVPYGNICGADLRKDSALEPKNGAAGASLPLAFVAHASCVPPLLSMRGYR